MKSLKNLMFVVAAMLTITAYGQNETDATPSSVVKKFTEATLQNFDFAKAKQYVVQAQQNAFDEAIAHLENPEQKATIEMMKTVAANLKIDVVDEKIEENNATVTVKITGLEAMGVQAQEQVIHLVKEDGAWKITADINKKN